MTIHSLNHSTFRAHFKDDLMILKAVSYCCQLVFYRSAKFHSIPLFEAKALLRFVHAFQTLLDRTHFINQPINKIFASINLPYFLTYIQYTVFFQNQVPQIGRSCSLRWKENCHAIAKMAAKMGEVLC